MIRLYKNGDGECLVQTSCLDCDSFVGELAEAMSKIEGDDKDIVLLSVLQNAMPIAFKLSGYKADTVSEQRTLVCGRATPNAADVILTVGR